MWKRIKKLFHSTAFNIFLVFALAGFVLFFTLKDNKEQVLSALSRVSVPWLIFMIGMMVFERWLLGCGLTAEVRLTHPKYKISQGFVNSYTAGLFNDITPSASGGQIAQSYIFRKQGIPVAGSVGVLWLDFIVYQTTMCSLVLLLILLRFHYFYTQFSHFFLIAVFGFLIGAGIIVFLWVLAESPRFYTWLTTKGIEIGARLHIVRDKEKTLAQLNTQLEQFAREIVVLKNHKKMIAFLALDDLIRLIMYYSIPYFCAIALKIRVTASMYFDILALSSFVAMVNAFLPMPGSSGGTEATFVLMFSTIFSRTEAASIMILWRLVTFYQVLIIGSIVFLYGRTRKDIPVEPGNHPVTYTEKAFEQGEA